MEAFGGPLGSFGGLCGAYAPARAGADRRATGIGTGGDHGAAATTGKAKHAGGACGALWRGALSGRGNNLGAACQIIADLDLPG